MALARRGHRVTVLEKRIGASEAGAGLQVSPNASHVLARWGLLDALRAAAVEPAGLGVGRWGDEAPFASMPFGLGRDGAPFLAMHRADLHAALRAAALSLPDVTLHEGHAFEGMTSDGGSLRLRFVADRRPVEVGAAVAIGADGRWSRMRKELGDSRGLDPPRWEAWRTLVPAEAAPVEARLPRTVLRLAPDAHAVHYPVAGGRLVNLVVIRRGEGETDGWDGHGDPARIAPLARTAGPTLGALIAAAPGWAVWSLRDRIPAVRLAEGPLAVVGDAAHPVLPFLAQGAAMAIEDAEVLARSLPAPEKLTTASAAEGLARYAAERAQRVHRVFKAARENAFAYHLSGPLAALRDWRIRSLGADGMRQRYSWLYDWRAPF